LPAHGARHIIKAVIETPFQTRKRIKSYEAQHLIKAFNVTLIIESVLALFYGISQTCASLLKGAFFAVLKEKRRNHLHLGRSWQIIVKFVPGEKTNE